MSHKATSWLASLPPNRIGASEFRVLFHLCDCHNPSMGCFPTQAYLMACTGASNGTVNNALNALEAKGLIKRHRSFDGKTKRQKPTRYTLGFEMSKGSGPTPDTGVGAVSNLEADPSPIQRPTRLQPTGEEPVKEPVNNLEREAEQLSQTEKAARFWAGKIGEGKPVASSAISAVVARFIVDRQLLTADQMRRAGLAV